MMTASTATMMYQIIFDVPVVVSLAVFTFVEFVTVALAFSTAVGAAAVRPVLILAFSLVVVPDPFTLVVPAAAVKLYNLTAPVPPGFKHCREVPIFVV